MSNSTDTVDKLVVFLAKRDGIDKLVKTFQYVSKLVHWHAESSTHADVARGPRAGRPPLASAGRPSAPGGSSRASTPSAGPRPPPRSSARCRGLVSAWAGWYRNWPS
uniref:Uncharacterized protein n=1 Tax=Ananas comosus var. bracteatus TaxID=296719 RepID=A0A6V7QNU5_ANACO|nr:unnamed protein product [Ananas comosus var. bracteatus]